jgi:hypothetical protein
MTIIVPFVGPWLERESQRTGLRRSPSRGFGPLADADLAGVAMGDKRTIGMDRIDRCRRKSLPGSK